MPTPRIVTPLETPAHPDSPAAPLPATSADDPQAQRFSYRYAYLITGMTFLFIFLAAFGPALLPPLPDQSWRVIDTVLGFLLGVGLSAIIQFFYGSSQGSQQKSEQLHALAQRLSTQSPGAGS